MNPDRISSLFDDNFAKHGELGASLSIWRDGTEFLSLAAGWSDRERTQPWTAATPVLFWSVTKGLSAACLLHALQARGLDPLVLVSDHWPEFAQAGKARITVAEMMSHQAGLSALSHSVPVTDYDAVIRALAAQRPHWAVGEGHGYHPRTFGFLLDETLRRITGTTLRDYWRAHFAEPLGLDVWIGLPSEIVPRVAPVFPAAAPLPADDPFYRALLASGSLTARSFASPRGLHSVAALNRPDALAHSFPAFGGIGTARSVARFYAMLAAGGELDGMRFFEPRTLRWMSHSLTQGADRVLQIQTAFSAGFMRDPLSEDGRKIRKLFGSSAAAFGHPGAGGSHAFADPERHLSFAYVMNQMEPGLLPGPRALRLVDALDEC